MKKALITGASHGIGLAIAKEFLKNGIAFYDCSRTSGYNLLYKKDLEKAISRAKVFDILINNVGGMGTSKVELSDLCMRKNYGIMKDLTLAYLSVPREWGRIVTIGSIYGKERGINPWFDASKAAEIAFMKCMSHKYIGTKTTMNTICPGRIDVGKTADSNIFMGKPEDVAHIVYFLCTDKAKHINGACIVVDGGESHSY